MNQNRLRHNFEHNSYVCTRKYVHSSTVQLYLEYQPSGLARPIRVQYVLLTITTGHGKCESNIRECFARAPYDTVVRSGRIHILWRGVVTWITAFTVHRRLYSPQQSSHFICASRTPATDRWQKKVFRQATKNEFALRIIPTKSEASLSVPYTIPCYATPHAPGQNRGGIQSSTVSSIAKCTTPKFRASATPSQ